MNRLSDTFDYFVDDPLSKRSTTKALTTTNSTVKTKSRARRNRNTAKNATKARRPTTAARSTKDALKIHARGIFIITARESQPPESEGSTPCAFSEIGTEQCLRFGNRQCYSLITRAEVFGCAYCSPLAVQRDYFTETWVSKPQEQEAPKRKILTEWLDY